MATMTRTIGRIATLGTGSAPLPAWRQAMTEIDRLYNVSADIPNSANASLVFPHGGVVPYGWGTKDDQGWDVMSGYSSGVLLEDVGGPFGTLVVGTGGHTRVQNNLLSLNLSLDSPGFGWWQQPYFEASAVNGAELYYNLSEFNQLPGNRKTGTGTGSDEVAMTAAWIAGGAQFPMGFCGWIFPQKLVHGQLGNNNPHGFRYHAPCYIPPSMTGTGSGAYVVVEAPQGPFAQSYLPSGASASQLFHADGLHSSGRRRWPIYAKNTQTGTWTRLPQAQPDVPWYGWIRLHTAVAPDQKRVYVSGDVVGGTAAYWYIDFSNGLNSATVSQVFQGPTPLAPNRGSAGAFTAGHPAGRHLWYWADLNNPSHLAVQDLDSSTHYRVGPIAGYSVGANVEDALIYDASHNRILVVRRPSGDTITYQTIALPSDPRNAAGYVATGLRTVTADGSVAVGSLTGYYKKCFLHPALGVVFIPQSRGRMLAFRPSA